MSKPIYEEISYQAPEGIFNLFSKDNWVMWLDSADAATQQADRNRYSYIAIDPFETLISQQGQVICSGNTLQVDALTALQTKLAEYALASVPELPPLQTGAVGYWAYDLCHYLEPVPLHRITDMKQPEMAVGFYDVVIAFDHHAQRAWIIASGLPEQTETMRVKRAKMRLAEFKGRLAAFTKKQADSAIKQSSAASKPVANFNRQSYEAAVQRLIDYIKAGDLFEANLSQRFSMQLPDNFNNYALYRRLRRLNAAPFSAFIRVNNTVIASSSPERFLKLHNRYVETRPIKGTRPRSADQVQDRALADELIASEKDRAENIMIVDLMRNDLSKVCEDTSVAVTQLCALESFETVHHLVSAVVGKLRADSDAVSLLKATFPGGSITGAPKVRAMQIIAELEPHSRGVYCGSIGYISFSGDMDTSIVIRTYVMDDRQLSFHGGGAIVLDSQPDKEYDETLDKVRSLQQALSLD